MRCPLTLGEATQPGERWELLIAPVRIRYSHGHDIRTHQLGRQVGRIAAKKACVDFLMSQHFAPLIPMGFDKISMEQQIENWSIEVNEFLTKFNKIKVF